MKRYILILMTLLLAVPALWSQSDSSGYIDSAYSVKMTFDDGATIYASLDDTPEAAALFNMLPMTLSFENSDNSMASAALPKKPNISGEPVGCAGEKGTIGYYAPWNAVCIFYNGCPMKKGLVLFGSIENGGEDKIGNMDGIYSVKIEKN